MCLKCISHNCIFIFDLIPKAFDLILKVLGWCDYKWSKVVRPVECTVKIL